MSIFKIVVSTVLAVTLSACAWFEPFEKRPATPKLIPSNLPPLEDRSSFQVLVKTPEGEDRNSRILCDDIRFCILEEVFYFEKFGRYRHKIFVQVSTNFQDGMRSVFFDLGTGTILDELPSENSLIIKRGAIPEEGWIELHEVNVDQVVCQVGFLVDHQRIVYTSQVMFSPCDDLYFILFRTDDETLMTVLSLQPLQSSRYIDDFDPTEISKFLQNPTSSLKAQWLTLRRSRSVR